MDSRFEADVTHFTSPPTSLPEDAKQLSKPGLHRHHEGDGCQPGETRGADLAPEQADDHHRLERRQPQVVQVERNLS